MLKYNKGIENACTAFPSTFVSMLELCPPLPVLLLLRVGGLSRLNTRAVPLCIRNATRFPVHWLEGPCLRVVCLAGIADCSE
jgi:hypothetical protein